MVTCARFLALAASLIITPPLLAADTLSQRDYGVIDRAISLKNEKRYAEAEALLALLLANGSPMARGYAYQIMGFMKVDQDQPDAAIDAFRSAISSGGLNPTQQSTLLTNIGVIEARAGNCKQALEALNGGRAGAKPDKAANAALTVCSADEGFFEDAAASYKEAMAQISEPTAARLQIGRDIESASRNEKLFPVGHFSRTLYDEKYFGTRPARSAASCSASLPASAKESELSGSTTIVVKVDAIGKASGAKVAHTTLSPELAQAALDAARNCTFRPALKDGQPVESEVEMTYSLKQRPKSGGAQQGVPADRTRPAGSSRR